MLCDNCLEIITNKLKEDDIAVLQYLYNTNITIPQFAQNKKTIMKGMDNKISHFLVGMALYRLECFNMVQLRTWDTANSFYITEDGIRALQILSRKMEG